MDSIEVLKEIIEIDSVAGHEQELSSVLCDKFTDLGYDVSSDGIGNVIAFMKGDSPDLKVMIAAHFDQIGMIVTGIDKQGFVQVSSIGGVDSRILPGQELYLYGREKILGVVCAKPPHLMKPDEQSKSIKMEDILVDIGYSYSEAIERVRVGDIVAFKSKFTRHSENIVSSKSLDNKAGVMVLLETARILKEYRINSDVYLVSTSQEEVGTRGVKVATRNISPDIGIAIDVTFGRTPELPKEDSSQLGEGPVLAIGGNISENIHKILTKAAIKANLNTQLEVCPASTGTDAWSMQISNSGVPTALISIPLKYMHTTVEMINYNDVRQSAKLLAHFLLELNSCKRGDIDVIE